jgi:phosphopentomutase
VKRAFVIVIDACGAGELPDAADYGDAGANTLGHVAEAAGGLDVPVLQRLGLGDVLPLASVPPSPEPVVHGRLHPLGPGKDTITGHWELMGVVTPVPLRTYPDGFPDDVIDQLRDASGRGVLCNRPYSGTAVIDDFGARHLATGDLIVYTSADSVLQIAAHTDEVPTAELYAICAAARETMSGEHAVGRVIARPFRGPVALRAARISPCRPPDAPTWRSCRPPGSRRTPSGRSARCSTASASTTSTKARRTPPRWRRPRR